MTVCTDFGVLYGMLYPKYLYLFISGLLYILFFQQGFSNHHVENYKEHIFGTSYPFYFALLLSYY